MKTLSKSFSCIAIALVTASLCATSVAQQVPATKKISSITVDPGLPVIGPDGITIINDYVHGGISDEHSTIFSPGTLPFQGDYLFFVASHTPLTPSDTGLLVLQAKPNPPARSESWSMDFAPDYGLYPSGNGFANGVVFTSAITHGSCSLSSISGVAVDPTFDLSYAAPGTVLVDPTNPLDWGGGSLLMIYEGTNVCFGPGVGASSGGFFSTIGIATSTSLGLNWPIYKANFTALPGINQSAGPNAPKGAWGPNVCWGNFCSNLSWLEPSEQYGRYAVSGPAITVEQAMAESSLTGLTSNVGDSEPAAFVDDVHRNAIPPYVYVVHTYNAGQFTDVDSLANPGFSVEHDLSISRGQLNGGTARLSFFHWYDDAFHEPGLGSGTSTVLGGRQSPIFTGLAATADAYNHCLTTLQGRSDGSISYSEDTHEYVLLFVCDSPAEPGAVTAYPPPTSPGSRGGSWFYSTLDADRYDLSDQNHWSTPQQVDQSWSAFPDPPAGCNANFDGWYPSLMSPGAKPGHLNATGWVFYMKGCQTAGNKAGPPIQRTYSTRYFVISSQ